MGEVGPDYADDAIEVLQPGKSNSRLPNRSGYLATKVLGLLIPAMASARLISMGVLTATCAAGALRGQELVCLDPSGGLYRVDPRSGFTTHIGNSGLTAELWTSLAQDSNQNLYATYGFFDHPFEIHRIDPATGYATFMSQTSLVGVSGMAFGPNDELYVTNDPSAPLGRDYDLVRVDLLTGASTVIGTTGVRGITALDFDDQGRLWAYDHERGLVELDLAWGTATDHNTNFIGPPDPTKSMVFGENDALWMIDVAVWLGDTTTGVPSLVHPMSQFGIFSGLEYKPGPAPPFALWTLGETGSPMGARISGATPSGLLVLVLAHGGGGPTFVPAGNPCAGILLDLNASMAPFRVVRADAQGRALIGPSYVPVSAAGSVRLQALDLTSCATSNLARIVF